MSLHLYCYVWRTGGINQNASSLTAEKCLFLVSEAHVFISVWRWSIGSHQPRRERMFFFLIWQPFQICIHQWLLLSTSDLMLPITVHVFKPQKRLYWQIQSTQATSTYKYHILKTFFVYSTRLKTTALWFYEGQALKTPGNHCTRRNIHITPYLLVVSFANVH